MICTSLHLLPDMSHLTSYLTCKRSNFLTLIAFIPLRFFCVTNILHLQTMVPYHCSSSPTYQANQFLSLWLPVVWSENYDIVCYRMIVLNNPFNPCHNPLSAAQDILIFILGTELRSWRLIIPTSIGTALACSLVVNTWMRLTMFQWQ